MDRRGQNQPVPGEPPQRGRPVSVQEAATAKEYFDAFLCASTLRTILGTYRNICDCLHLKPNALPLFYPKLKANLNSWKAKALWKKFDLRANSKCYGKGKLCPNTRVLIIGGGPCGLRTAIEAQLLGAKVVVVEKRDRISRNNVLHLWPFVIDDLRLLGAKKFYGKFCAGAIDHISIRQLQCILLKVALLIGVEIHTEVSFEGLIEPNLEEKTGWRAHCKPAEHPVSQFEFDVIIGADGKRNTLQGFKRKEFRGKLAIAITANFINKNTEAEARVEEISGVAFIFNQKFFKELHEETAIDLENIVYYKDETHYFVMTAKKHSLIYKGVIKKDLPDTARLLAPENVDREALMQYARDAAEFSTHYNMLNLEFAVNHYGQPDVAMFDFTSMYAAENASRLIERHGYRLLSILVGDSLLEPFWPTGSGCARGFLSSLDAAWAIRGFGSGHMTPLEVIAERESIYRLLAQTTPENLNKDYKSYTLDPATRYPNLNKNLLLPQQVLALYDSDEPNAIEVTTRHLLEAPKKRRRRESHVDPETLILWIRDQLKEHPDLAIDDITHSLKDGRVLCAVINHYRPDLLDYGVVSDDSALNNQIAFDLLEKEIGIPPVMTGDEMSNSEVPDFLTMVAYLTQIYDVFRCEIPHIKHPKLCDPGHVQTVNPVNPANPVYRTKFSLVTRAVEPPKETPAASLRGDNSKSLTLKMSELDMLVAAGGRPRFPGKYRPTNRHRRIRPRHGKRLTKSGYALESKYLQARIDARFRAETTRTTTLFVNEKLRNSEESLDERHVEIVIRDADSISAIKVRSFGSRVSVVLPRIVQTIRRGLGLSHLTSSPARQNRCFLANKFLSLAKMSQSESNSPAQAEQTFDRVVNWISASNFDMRNGSDSPKTSSVQLDGLTDITSVTRQHRNATAAGARATDEKSTEIVVERFTDLMRFQSDGRPDVCRSKSRDGKSNSMESINRFLEELKSPERVRFSKFTHCAPPGKLYEKRARSRSEPPGIFSVIIENEENDLPPEGNKYRENVAFTKNHPAIKSIAAAVAAAQAQQQVNSPAAGLHQRPPASRHKRHVDQQVPAVVSTAVAPPHVKTSHQVGNVVAVAGAGAGATGERKQRKRKSSDKINIVNLEDRVQRQVELCQNRAERQTRRRCQRRTQTDQFIKSMQMLQANCKPDHSEPFEDYSIFLYRQTAPIFEDRVKDLEKKFTYVPENRPVLSKGERDEDFRARIKGLEEKHAKPSTTASTEKKPRDLLRAIGKIDNSDWNIKEIEKKIIENRHGGRNVNREKEKVPKWSREQFLARQTKMEKQHLERQDSNEAKYAEIDKNIRMLDQRLKEGSVRDQKHQKISLITEKLVPKTEEIKPIQKTNSKSIMFPQNNSDTCHFCGKRVYLMERLSAENKFFHRGCFRCQYCQTLLRLGSYAYDRDGRHGYKFYCLQHVGMQGELLPPPPPSSSKTSKVARKPSTRSPEKKKVYDGVAGFDLLDRVQTPERIEFANLSGNALSDHEESLSQMDEDEWTDRNFGNSTAEFGSSEDDDSSSLSDTDSDDEDAYEEALEEPPTKEGTMRWMERYSRRYSRKRDSDDYSSSDHSSYCENSSGDDDTDTATEGEEEIRARELRKQEVRVEPPVVHTDTGTDTEVKQMSPLNASRQSETSPPAKSSARSSSSDEEDFGSAESEPDAGPAPPLISRSATVGSIVPPTPPVKVKRNFVLPPKENRKSFGKEFVPAFRSNSPEPLLIIKRTPSKINLPPEVGKPKVAVKPNLDAKKYFGTAASKTPGAPSLPKRRLSQAKPEKVENPSETKVTFNFELKDDDLNDVDDYIENLLLNEDELMKPIDPSRYRTRTDLEEEKLSSSIEDLLKALENENEGTREVKEDDKMEELLNWMEDLDYLDHQPRKVSRSSSDAKYKNLERALKSHGRADSALISKLPRDNLKIFEMHLSGRGENFALARSKTDALCGQRRSVDLDAVGKVDIKKVLKKFESFECEDDGKNQKPIVPQRKFGKRNSFGNFSTPQNKSEDEKFHHWNMFYDSDKNSKRPSFYESKCVVKSTSFINSHQNSLDFDQLIKDLDENGRDLAAKLDDFDTKFTNLDKSTSNLNENPTNFHENAPNFHENAPNSSNKETDSSQQVRNLNETKNLIDETGNFCDETAFFRENSAKVSEIGASFDGKREDLNENDSNLVETNANFSKKVEHFHANACEHVTNVRENATNVNENASDSRENATNSSENVTKASGNGSNLNEYAANSSGNSTNFHEITTNIGKEATNASENASNLNENAANSSENATNSRGNFTKVNENVANLSGNSTNFHEIAANISGDATNTSENAANLNENAGNSRENATNSSELVTKVNKNVANLRGNSTNFHEIATNIGKEATNASENAANLNENTANSSENATNSRGNFTKLNENVTNLSGNSTNFHDITTNIGKEATNASQNAANLKENAANSLENATNSSENVTKVIENVTNLSGNSTNVHEIATNISKNVTNASENAANLSENAASLQEKSASLSDSVENFKEIGAIFDEKGENLNKKGTNLSEKAGNFNEKAATFNEKASNVHGNSAKLDENAVNFIELAAILDEKGGNFHEKDTNSVTQTANFHAKASNHHGNSAKLYENVVNLDEIDANFHENDANLHREDTNSIQITADFNEKVAILHETSQILNENNAKCNEFIPIFDGIGENSNEIDASSIENLANCLENGANFHENVTNFHENRADFYENVARFDEQVQNFHENSANLNLNSKNLNEESASLNENSAHVNEKSANLNENFADVNKNSAGFDEQVQNFQKKSVNLNEKSANLNEKSGNLNEKSANLNEKSANLNEKSANLNEKSGNLNEHSADLNENFADANKNSARFDVQVQNFLKNSADLNERSANLNEKSADLNETLANFADVNENSTDLSDNSASFHEAGAIFDAQRENLNENKANLNEKGTNFNKEAASLGENTTNFNENVSNLNEIRANFDEKAANLNKTITNLSGNASNLKEEVANFNGKPADLDHKCAKINKKEKKSNKKCAKVANLKENSGNLKENVGKFQQKTGNSSQKAANFSLKTENFNLKPENFNLKAGNFNVKAENFNQKTSKSNETALNFQKKATDFNENSANLRKNPVKSNKKPVDLNKYFPNFNNNVVKVRNSGENDIQLFSPNVKSKETKAKNVKNVGDFEQNFNVESVFGETLKEFYKKLENELNSGMNTTNLVKTNEDFDRKLNVFSPEDQDLDEILEDLDEAIENVSGKYKKFQRKGSSERNIKRSVGEVNSKLEDFDAKLADSDAKLENSDAKLENSDAKLEKSDAKLPDSDAKLENADAKLGDSDLKLENSDVKLDDSGVKLGISDVKLGDSDVKLDDSGVKLEISDEKLGDSDVKLGYLNMKLGDLNMKLGDSDVKLANSDVKFKDSDVKLGNSDVKLSDSEVKFVISDAKLGNSDVKLDDSDVKFKISDEKLCDSDLKLEDSHVKLNVSSVKIEDSVVKFDDSIDDLENLNLKFEDLYAKLERSEVKLKNSGTSDGKFGNSDANLADSNANLVDSETKLEDSGAKLANPDAKLENLAAKLKDSNVKLEISDTKRENSDAKPEDSGAKLETLVAKLENSDAKLENSVTKLECSDAKLGNSDAKHENLAAKLEDSNVKLEISDKKRENSDGKPENSGAKLETLVAKLESSDAKLETSDVKLETSEAKLESLDAKLENSDAKLETSDVKLETSEAKLESSDAKLENSDAKLEDSRTKLEIFDAKLEKSDAKLENADAKLEDLDAKLEDLNVNLKDSGTKLESSDAELEDLDVKLELVDAKLEPVDAKLEPVEAKLELVDAKLEPVDAKLELLDAKLEPSDAKLELVDAKLELVDAKLEPVDAKLEPSDAKLEKAVAKLADSNVKLEGSRAKLEGSRAKLEDSHAKLEDSHAKLKLEDVRLENLTRNVANNQKQSKSKKNSSRNNEKMRANIASSSKNSENSAGNLKDISKNDEKKMKTNENLCENNAKLSRVSKKNEKLCEKNGNLRETNENCETPIDVKVDVSSANLVRIDKERDKSDRETEEEIKAEIDDMLDGFDSLTRGIERELQTAEENKRDFADILQKISCLQDRMQPTACAHVEPIYASIDKSRNATRSPAVPRRNKKSLKEQERGKDRLCVAGPERPVRIRSADSSPSRCQPAVPSRRKCASPESPGRAARNAAPQVAAQPNASPVSSDKSKPQANAVEKPRKDKEKDCCVQ